MKRVFWVSGIIAYTLVVGLAGKYLFYDKGYRDPASNGWKSHGKRMSTRLITHHGISCIVVKDSFVGISGIACDFNQ